MASQDGIYALIKIGEKHHMEDLIQNGALFLRRLKAYRNIECPVRADSYEGASDVFQPENVVLTVNETRIEDFVGPLSVDGRINPLVYCMYALSPKHRSCVPGTYLDERCYEFGDTAVYIADVMAFYERLKRAATQLRFNLRSGLVEYVSCNGYSGEWGPFRKFDDLSYQHEWRAVFGIKTTEETFRLELGSLCDIAKIGSIQDLNRAIEFVDDPEP